MTPDYFELRKLVIEQYREIAATDPDYQSVEWYLMRYLKRIEQQMTPVVSPARVENSMRGFIRFYVDNIGSGTELEERCLGVYRLYRRIIRDSRGG